MLTRAKDNAAARKASAHECEKRIGFERITSLTLFMERFDHQAEQKTMIRSFTNRLTIGKPSRDKRVR